MVRQEKHVGFTGTRRGMTEYQQREMLLTLEQLRREGFGFFHHGDCIGADEQAHHIATSLGYGIIIHPPTRTKERAFVIGGECRPAYPYLERNDHIIGECEVILATPGGPEQMRGSGTWYTIRHATQLKRDVRIIQ